MTCFWNAIISRLDKNDYNLMKIIPIRRNMTDIQYFIHQLKGMAIENEFNIKWQNKELNEQEKNEMKEFIKDYNINTINRGHLTSSCDPFLCLLADLLKCRIEFNYRKHLIIFETKELIRKVFKFNGSTSHFS